MGSGVIGNRSESVNKNITMIGVVAQADFDVEEAGIVIGMLPSCAEASCWGGPVPPGTDAGLHHEPVALVGTQFLVCQVNLDPFRTAED